MNLVHDWKRIIRKAWSVRLIIAAGVLSGAEVILPYFDDTLPKGIFAFLSFVVTAAAFVSRIVAQPKMYESDARK